MTNDHWQMTNDQSDWGRAKTEESGDDDEIEQPTSPSLSITYHGPDKHTLTPAF